MTVLLAGHLCVDLTPRLPGDPVVEPGRLAAVGALHTSLGGSVANTGRVLAHLGIPIRAAAALGDDALGTLAGELLAREGFDTSEVRLIGGVGTSYSIVIEPQGHDRTFWHHAGANDHFRPDDISLEGLDLVHVGYPSLLAELATDGGEVLRRFFGRAQASGVATSLDLAVVDPDSAAAQLDWERFLGAVLPVTDLFTPSIDDLSSALGGSASLEERVEDALSRGAGIVAVTAGDRGVALGTASSVRLAAGGAAIAALSGWSDIRMTMPAAPVDVVVSTNGAGDAATAGFIAALLVAANPETALRFAGNCAASLVAGRALPSLPEESGATDHS
jgi:sugar/nucleoside kinase (ribokinase family)